MRSLALFALLAAPAASAQAWVAGTPLPSPRAGAAVAVLDGKIYVIGGRGASTYPLDTAIRFDPETGVWSAAGTLDHGRVNGFALILDGRLLVTGGRREDGDLMDDVEEYVPASNTWFESSECSLEREGHAAFALGDVAYTIGGISEGGNYLGDAEWYQYGAPFWLPYAPWHLQIPRASFAVAYVGSGVVIMGGYSTFGPQADVEYYVAEVGGEPRAPLPAPRGGLGAATMQTPDGQRVYAVGGRDASNVVSSRVDIYDPVADTWSAGPDLPAPRERAAVVQLDGRLYVIGGGDAAGATTTVYTIDIETAVAGGPDAAGALALGAPTPNPTPGATTIPLVLAEAGEVDVEVFDTLGRRVAVLQHGILSAGVHELHWAGRAADGRDAPAGVYVVRARQDGRVASARLTLTR